MQANARMKPGDVAIAGGGRPYTALAALAHALIWSVVPALVIGNMHQDTLEAAFWGGDLALGYPEHPPLLSWVIGLALRIGHAPIFTLLLISQAGMVVAAAYVWRTVRFYASRGAAAMAVTLTLISPAATVYGVQVNHNSFLAPFWAAALFYGLAYLEGGRWRDALLFAVAAGLGALVKYPCSSRVAGGRSAGSFARQARRTKRAPAANPAKAAFPQRNAESASTTAAAIS